MSADLNLVACQSIYAFKEIGAFWPSCTKVPSVVEVTAATGATLGEPVFAEREAATELFFTSREARTALSTKFVGEGASAIHTRGSWGAAVLDQTEVFIADKDSVSFTKNITIRFARFATGQAWLARGTLGKVGIADLVKGAIETFEATVFTVEDGLATFGAD